MAAVSRRYGTKADIVNIFSISRPTVYRRVKGIESEIGKRYNRYAIADNLISLAVFADYQKYHKRLENKNTRKSVPQFDMDEALMYLGEMEGKG